jgi:polyhydroxyalkanoate synthesis regulator phasin
MDERIKSLIYTAVGLASTSEKARKLLESFHIEGKLSEEEGRRIIDEIMTNTTQTGMDIKEQLEQKIQEILLELQMPSRKEWMAMQERFSKIEQELEKLKKHEL